MLKPEQIKVIHIYKSTAGLSTPAYRELLRARAGVYSSVDEDFTQSSFEHVMAALETVVFDRVDRGEISDPIGFNRWIRDRFYWRNRLPAVGRINSRQFALINRLWNQLSEFLPREQCTAQYLSGIIFKSTGKHDVGASALNSNQASALIDALRDRLSYAIRVPRPQLAETLL